ncbi:hypothetical protein SAMN05444166_1028 [Singulisphaera sp. GP187]|uniref:hypothetical protein n=1 Tax=Singulisphaera sp. GP187 TaxID=1882752 RepID=UPI00092AB124|nr:hypothetical protein [Singulisphaera sp. GP187]SIN81236.1 hypothetical protein SAMN05444166_1028 [Singulisphaera sp. GP187]
MLPVNRGIQRTTSDQVVPPTTTDHLLSEDERLNAVRDREAVEALGRELDRRLMRQAMYPIYYDAARKQVAAGVSHEAIRAELNIRLADIEDEFDASVAREAYEDALADRPQPLDAESNS